MGVAFFETMRGDIWDAKGVPHRLEFQIKAEADLLGAFLRTGSCRITGVVQAPPWQPEGLLEGTVTVSLRAIRYAFAFDPGFRFEGQKTIRMTSLIESFTALKGSLWKDGERLGEGTIFFRLGDLPDFLASWNTATSFRRLNLDSLDLVSERETEFIRAIAEAAIEPDGRVPRTDDRTAEGVVRQLAAFPPELRSLWRFGALAMRARARAHRGRAFTRLPVELRRKLANPTLFRLLAAPVRVAHFDRTDTLEAIGFPSLESTDREPPPRWLEQVTAAEALEPETELEADVVVIGSGAGGGAVAASLAEKGLGTVVIEEGPYLRRGDFSGDVISRIRRAWRDGGITGTVGAPPISIPLGRVVGGTTTINSGTCFRTPESVLSEWRERGFPADFCPESLARYFDAVEAELQVTPAEPRTVGKVADIVARGAEALHMQHGPLPRNAPGCDAQGTCIFGCPTGAKRSSDISWIPRALQAGAALFTGIAARRLLMRGRRVVGVEARGVDAFGAAKRVRVRARAVVISCGTFFTPILLQENGIFLPWIGKNLSVHPAMGMWLAANERLEPWHAIPQGYGVEGPEGIRFEGFYLPPPLAASLLPLKAEELNRWVDGDGCVAQFGFMVRDDSVGRVRRGPTGRPIARYDLSPRSCGRLQAGAALLAELLLKGGATEVLPGIVGVRPIRSVEQARNLASRRIRAVDYCLLGAHPLGTCRMGATPAEGVVDFENRVHGTDNLYIADGSVVPTSLGVNPQVTIMTLALRAADSLAEKLTANS